MRKFIVLAALLPLVLFSREKTGWSRTYDFGSIVQDQGCMMLETYDGDYAVLARVGEESSMLLLKVDVNGEMIWSKDYTCSNLYMEGHFEQTQDSGFIIVSTIKGNADEDEIYVIKTDNQGDTIWTKSFGFGLNFRPEYIGQTIDKGYIIISESSDLDYDQFDIIVLRLDSLGDTISTHIYGDEHDDYLNAANRVGSQYVFVGIIPSMSDNNDLYTVVVLNQDGGLVRSGGYTSISQDPFDQPFKFNHVDCGHYGYIFAGYAYSTTGPNLRISEAFPDQPYEPDEYWYNVFPDSFGIGRCIKPTLDSGYIVVSDRWTLLKTDDDGDSLWTRNYDGNGYYVIQTSDSCYLVTGSKDDDLWLLKVDANGDTLAAITERHLESSNWAVSNIIGRTVTLQYSNSPNGFRASVFDASGRMVDEVSSVSPSGSVTWGQGQIPGVYFIRSSGENRSTARIVIVR